MSKGGTGLSSTAASVDIPECASTKERGGGPRAAAGLLSLVMDRVASGSGECRGALNGMEDCDPPLRGGNSCSFRA